MQLSLICSLPFLIKPHLGVPASAKQTDINVIRAEGPRPPMGHPGGPIMAGRMQLQAQQQLRGNFHHQQPMMNQQQQQHGPQGMMVQHHHPHGMMQQPQQQHRQQQQQQQAQQIKPPGSLPLPPNFHVMQALALGRGRDNEVSSCASQLSSLMHFDSLTKSRNAMSAQSSSNKSESAVGQWCTSL